MWTSWPNRKIVLAAFLLSVVGIGPSAAAPINSITIAFSGTDGIFTAGITTNTNSTVILINTFASGGNPDAGEVVTLQLLDNGNVVSNGMSPSSFTTTGTGIVNGGNSPLPITFFRTGTSLQIRAISATNQVTNTGAAFTVLTGSATKLLVLGPGMTHEPGTNPSLTTGFSGSVAAQEPNQAFVVRVILTDNQFNTVSANHVVSFASGDLITLPSPDALVNGVRDFNVTMTGARITRTITVSDSTDPGVAAGTLDVTTVGPPPKEVFPFPSPFNPNERDITFRFRFDEPKEATVIVTDLFGQSVWKKKVSAPVGVTDVPWNGRNDQGHVVASGVYYVLLEVGGSIESKKRFGVIK